MVFIVLTQFIFDLGHEIQPVSCDKVNLIKNSPCKKKTKAIMPETPNKIIGGDPFFPGKI